MLEEMIKALQLSELLKFEDGSPVESAEDWQRRRSEILALLCEEEYGLRPSEPPAVSVTVNRVNEAAYAGKVLEQHLMLSAEIGKGTLSFPLNIFVPKSKRVRTSRQAA